VQDQEWVESSRQEDNGYLFEEWLRKADLNLVQPRRGDILQGVIVQVGPPEMLVDIGAKRDGIVPARDLERLPPDLRASLAEGKEVSVIVTRVYEDTGDIELSISQALQEQDWVWAKDLLEKREIVECEVQGFNRGGLTVQFGQIRGFVPLSHVADIPRNLSPEQREQRMAELVGKRLPFMVIEVDRARRRLILSQREAIRALREARRDELLSSLKEGDIVQGRVRSIASFGVFVDLDGVDGLIHRSELSWDRVENVRDVVKVGQEIQAMVIKVDKKERKIGLSLKRLQPNPWFERIQKYRPGDIVPAVIANVTDFGAFAQIDEGIEGLIHVSELSPGGKVRPRDVIHAGDHVYVKILDIDPERQRISLSLRQAPQWEETEEVTSDESEDEDVSDAPADADRESPAAVVSLSAAE